LLQQRPFRGLELQTGGSESVEHLPKPNDVSVEVGGNEDDTIKVNEQGLPV